MIGTGAGAGPKCGSFASSAASDGLAAGAGSADSDGGNSGKGDGESDSDGVAGAETVFAGPQPPTNRTAAMPSRTRNREERTGKG